MRRHGAISCNVGTVSVNEKKICFVASRDDELKEPAQCEKAVSAKYHIFLLFNMHTC